LAAWQFAGEAKFAFPIPELLGQVSPMNTPDFTRRGFVKGLSAATLGAVVGDVYGDTLTAAE
jgi:hypothetical protein